MEEDQIFQIQTVHNQMTIKMNYWNNGMWYSLTYMKQTRGRLLNWGNIM